MPNFQIPPYMFLWLMLTWNYAVEDAGKCSFHLAKLTQQQSATQITYSNSFFPRDHLIKSFLLFLPVLNPCQFPPAHFPVLSWDMMLYSLAYLSQVQKQIKLWEMGQECHVGTSAFPRFGCFLPPPNTSDWGQSVVLMVVPK